MHPEVQMLQVLLLSLELGIVMPSGDTAYRGGRGRGVFWWITIPTSIKLKYY